MSIYITVKGGETLETAGPLISGTGHPVLTACWEGKWTWGQVPGFSQVDK